MIVLDEQSERTQFGIGGWLRDNGLGDRLQHVPAEPHHSYLHWHSDGAGAVNLQANSARDDHRTIYRVYVSYILLTIFGTSFRGPGQALMWPWDLPTTHGH